MKFMEQKLLAVKFYKAWWLAISCCFG